MWTPANGQKVRFHSKFDANLVLSATYGPEYCCAVYHLQNGPAPHKTVFEVESVGTDGGFSLCLRNLPDGCEDMRLMWFWPTSEYKVGYLALNPTRVHSGGDDYFFIDPLGDPWFALNNYRRNRVVDIYGSETYDGARIDAFPWNGGDNQWWRAELV